MASASTAARGIAVLALALAAAQALPPHGGAAGAASRAQSAAAAATVTVIPVRVKGSRDVARICRTARAGCTRLRARRAVAIGSFVDARAADVRLVTTRADGSPGRTTASRGIFELGLDTAPVPTVVARLAGAGFRAACGTAPPSRQSRKPPATPPFARRSAAVVRALRLDGTGAIRIAAGYADVTTTSARVLAEDRCDGTAVRVARGSVEVRELLTPATVTVSAGSSHLAALPELRGKVGVSNAARPARVDGYDGDAKICAAVGRGCHAVGSGTLVPVGAVVDATDGGISLETHRRDGSPARMTFYAGIFELRQEPTAGSPLNPRLTGGDYRRLCGFRKPRTFAYAKRRRRPPNRTPERLWGDGQGVVRTDGDYASAAASGTRYLVENGCYETRLRVTSGTIVARDRRRNIKKTLHAPASFVAQGPRR